MKKLLWVFVPIFVCSLFILITPGCKSGDKKTAQDTTTVKADSAARMADDTADTAASQVLHTVSMPVSRFREVFQTGQRDPNIRMIYFELNNSSPGHLGLRVWGANNRGVEQTGKFDLAVVSSGPVLQIRASQHDYWQQLTRGHIRAYLGQEESSDPIEDFEEIWLVPCMKTDAEGNSIIFFMATRPNTTVTCPDEIPRVAEGRMATNPAPPGEPCLDNCDDPAYRKIFNIKQLHNVVDEKKTY
jgi:hypothetical protein